MVIPMLSFITCIILIGSLDLSVAITNNQVVRWSLQQSNVCFGSRNDGFGKFQINQAGMLEALKFQHISGGVGCIKHILTNWGCQDFNYTIINLRVTDESNNDILPVGVTFNYWGGYKLRRYTSNSPILKLMAATPKYIDKKYLRVWYSEDLLNRGEDNNPTANKSCFNVYARINPQTKISSPWYLQQTDVCFGAKNNQYGQFKLVQSGMLEGLKFEHKSGAVGCHHRYLTNWGCHQKNYKLLNLLVTDEDNNVILPISVNFNKWGSYKLPGYTSRSNTLELLDNSTPKTVRKGKYMRIWFSEDLYKTSEQDNPVNKSCFNVYAKIVQTRAVTLQLKTTGCQHNCNSFDDSNTCPSSIKVNDKEMSTQKDGFNLLVIDRKLKVKRTAYSRWFNALDKEKYSKLKMFCTKIKSNSIIVIVFQKMCGSFDNTWYLKLANDTNIVMASSHINVYNIAIVVGCKDRCPADIEGSVPYSYYGQVDEYMVSITLRAKEYDNGKKDDNTTTIAGIIVALLLIIIIVIVLLLVCKRRYYTKKQVNNDNNAGDCTDTLIEENNLGNKASPQSVKNDLPYDYATISNANKSSEHIYDYVDPQTLITGNNEVKSVTPTTSRQKFPTSTDNSNNKFAEYVSIEGNSAVYKAPSSVPKFDAPTTTPKSTSSNYLDMSKDEKDNCEYQPVSNVKTPEADSPNQYEDMQRYNDEKHNDPTYQEISNGKTPSNTSNIAPRRKTSNCEIPSTYIDMNAEDFVDSGSTYEQLLNDNDINNSKVSKFDRPMNATESHSSDQYMDMSSNQTGNESTYQSLDNNDKNNDPVYQPLSTEGVEYECMDLPKHD